jgi:hypothetical protein
MRTTHLTLASLAWLAAAGPLLAQTASPAPAAGPSADPKSIVTTGQIEIVSIEPARGTVLKPGAPLSLKVKVRYKKSDRGPAQVQLLVQDQGRKPLLQKPPKVRLEKAEGEVDLKADVVVPKEGVTSIDVFVPMFSLDPAAKGTSTATFVKYTVAP